MTSLEARTPRAPAAGGGARRGGGGRGGAAMPRAGRVICKGAPAGRPTREMMRILAISDGSGRPAGPAPAGPRTGLRAGATRGGSAGVLGDPEDGGGLGEPGGGGDRDPVAALARASARRRRRPSGGCWRRPRSPGNVAAPTETVSTGIFAVAAPAEATAARTCSASRRASSAEAPGSTAMSRPSSTRATRSLRLSAPETVRPTRRIASEATAGPWSCRIAARRSTAI